MQFKHECPWWPARRNGSQQKLTQFSRGNTRALLGFELQCAGCEGTSKPRAFLDMPAHPARHVPCDVSGWPVLELLLQGDVKNSQSSLQHPGAHYLVCGLFKVSEAPISSSRARYCSLAPPQRAGRGVGELLAQVPAEPGTSHETGGEGLGGEGFTQSPVCCLHPPAQISSLRVFIQ